MIGGVGIGIQRSVTYPDLGDTHIRRTDYRAAIPRIKPSDQIGGINRTDRVLSGNRLEVGLGNPEPLCLSHGRPLEKSDPVIPDRSAGLVGRGQGFAPDPPADGKTHPGPVFGGVDTAGVKPVDVAGKLLL